MQQIRAVLVLIFFLNSFGNFSFAQNNTLSKVEIKKTAKLSVKYLNAENFEKSLTTARRSLHEA